MLLWGGWCVSAPLFLLALFGQLTAEKNELGLAATCAAFGALLPRWWYWALSPWRAELGAGGNGKDE